MGPAQQGRTRPQTRTRVHTPARALPAVAPAACRLTLAAPPAAFCANAATRGRNKAAR